MNSYAKKRDLNCYKKQNGCEMEKSNRVALLDN